MNPILNNAKKIRKILLSFIDTELKKNNKRNNNILIDSKSSTELSKQYQKYSDFRMEIIETYNCYQMSSTNYNNYFHVAVTYSQINNNYHVLYENKNFEKITSNDIVGSYIKGKTAKINPEPKYKKEKISYINVQQDKKKIIIGDKKIINRRKALYSSIAIPQKVLIPLDENNNSDNLNNKKTLNNLDNIPKIHNRNVNETICANKKRKLNVNFYEIKLKKYCSNLIKLKKKKTSKKSAEVKSPPIKRIQNTSTKRFTLVNETETQTTKTPNIKKIKDQPDIKSTNNKKQPKTRIFWNNPQKKPTHKRSSRAQSIKDTNILLQNLKNLNKKYGSPKKIKKQLTTQTNDSKNKEIVSQKISRKERGENVGEINSMKKVINGGVKNKRKMNPEKQTVKWNNKVFQLSNKLEHKHLVRKPLYQRANTLNKVNDVFKFKGNEIKLKEN